MTEIHATEMARTSEGRVLVHFSDESNADLLPGDRFYDAADFDKDPQAIIADFKKEYDARPKPVEEAPTKNAKPIVMTVDAADQKLAAMAEAATVEAKDATIQ